MNRHMQVLKCGAAVALAFLVAGCPRSNLHEKPLWVSDGFLPEAHPNSFDGSEFLSAVSTGTGTTLEAAIAAAEEDAEAFLERKITRAAISALEEGSSAHQELVQGLASENASRAISFMEKVAAWDGFERDLKYHFALYRLNKGEAGKSLLLGASDAYDRIKAIQSRLASEDPGQEQRERLALEALESILFLEVLKEQARVFDVSEQTKWIEDFNSLAQTATQQVIDAGRVREANGTEDDITAAVNLYREAARQRPSPKLEEALLRSEARMPCGECKEKVKLADSTRSELLDLYGQLPSMPHPESGRLSLRIVKGVKLMQETCQHPHAFFKERTLDRSEFKATYDELPAMRREASGAILASGKDYERSEEEQQFEEALELYSDFAAATGDPVALGRIQAIKFRLPCTECARAKDCVVCEGTKGSFGPCDKCSGTQQFLIQCFQCEGDGMKECGKCDRGSVYRSCSRCDRGQMRCSECSGRGRKELVQGIQTVCFICGGSGTNECPYCEGTGEVEKRCRNCGGKGRAGQCAKCSGRKKVFTPCDSCGDGKQFNDCERCAGSGRCRTCKGQGHRQ